MKSKTIKGKRLHLGKIYKIKFLDHCLSDEKILVTCQVIGTVSEISKDKLSICYWDCLDEKYQESNQEFVNIAIGTILEVKQLR